MCATERAVEGELRCTKCPNRAAYVCHHCATPICDSVPPIDPATRKLSRETRKDLERKKFHAIPLADDEFPEGTIKSGCLLPIFPDKKKLGTALHCADCAARHHAEGGRGFVSLIRQKP